MKAIRTHQTGGPETLTLDEIDAPTPGKGEVLVAVKACAINYPDGLIIRDMYQFKPQRPFSPGGEISGVIEAVGEGVEGFAVGDRVLAGIGNGGLAEKVVVPAGRMFKVPGGVPFEKAASLLMTYSVSMAIHMRRIEGRFPALAMIQFGLGAVQFWVGNGSGR